MMDGRRGSRLRQRAKRRTRTRLYVSREDGIGGRLSFEIPPSHLACSGARNAAASNFGTLQVFSDTKRYSLEFRHNLITRVPGAQSGCERGRIFHELTGSIGAD